MPPNPQKADRNTEPLVSRMGNPRNVAGGRGLELGPPLAGGSRFLTGRLQPVQDIVNRPRELVRALGLPLALDVPDPKWFGGILRSHLTMSDNSTVTWDLTAAAAFDQKFQNLYGSGADPECMLHVCGARIIVSASEAETPAVRGEFARKLYLQAIRAAYTTKEPLFTSVNWLAETTVDSDLAVSQFKSRSMAGWSLFQPFNVDLKTDQFTVALDSAVNSGADILFTLELLVAGWPNTVQIQDARTCGGSVLTTGPVEYAAALETFAMNPLITRPLAA